MILSGLSMNEMRNCTNSSNNTSFQFDPLKLKRNIMKIENRKPYLFVCFTPSYCHVTCSSFAGSCSSPAPTLRRLYWLKLWGRDWARSAVREIKTGVTSKIEHVCVYDVRVFILLQEYIGFSIQFCRKWRWRGKKFIMAFLSLLLNSKICNGTEWFFL